MIAYKAVHKDMSSSFGDQPTFEVGKTYTVKNAIRAQSGFHAAEDPIFCLNFIPPHLGRYFKVELQGELDPNGTLAGGDSATAAQRITFLQELSVEQMLWEAMQYRLQWAGQTIQTTSNTDKKLSSNTSRHVLAAVKPNTAVKVSGTYSLAIAEGKGCTAEAKGCGSLAVAFGKNTHAIADNNAWAIRICPDELPGKQIQILTNPYEPKM